MKSAQQNGENTPTVCVIFGALGDLSERKLIPALFDLYCKHLLPPVFQIVGFSRSDADTETFRVFVLRVLKERNKGRAPRGASLFARQCIYVQGLFEDRDAYHRLADALQDFDMRHKVCANKLFYLAVPPKSYESIFHHLSLSGLTIPCGGDAGWTRVIVEKPFGRDLATAQALDAKLGSLFKEEQIFRIDHYLAKETVQNILAFRFSNFLFEPVWNKEHIERVHIELWESSGIGRRAMFYEDVGALRDVGQNHMLQMLAIVAMEDPHIWDVESIRRARAEALASLVPIETVEDVKRYTMRGQYESYRKEDHVGTHSETETYFSLEARLDVERWRGVPFILTSGKRMKEHRARITVHFKKGSSCLCPVHIPHVGSNTLTFHIQPDEGISVQFWAKQPGLGMELEERTLSFLYENSNTGRMRPIEAYGRLLYDCIRGDQMLFTSTEEVAASWKFITPILSLWHHEPLVRYRDGSMGPLDDISN